MFISTVVVIFFNLVQANSLTVRTVNGVLNGSSYRTVEGREVTAFLGVPYAKPPINDLRFAEPQPVDDWNGVRTAQDFSSKCIQLVYYNTGSEPIRGAEDCLYLNVFTPALSPSSKLDVIVYIHGGAFMFGGGDMFLPDYILHRHDVVFVTINYRLGPFGFLTSEDGVIPGNLGLKDQVQALKWVQKNIENFGGARNKVTLIGFSAGGASVHLHFVSPLSQNLFQKGISVSGTAFCPWVLAENSRLKAIALASSVGCSTESSQQMLECLRVIPAKNLLNQIERLYMPWHCNPFSPFGVVLENSGENSFLSEHPYNLIKSGKVQGLPWLVSMTTEEGLYPAATFITNNTLLQQLEDKWSEIAPHLLDYNGTISPSQLNRVSEKIRKFYFGESKISKDKIKELVRMLSDRLFVVDIERAARLQASVGSPVYLYRFGYRGKYSLGDGFCKCEENFGSSHGDDLIFLLKSPFNTSPLDTEEDKEMMVNMVNMWMSFVKSGVPSINDEVVWTPVSANLSKKGSISYMTISSRNKIEQFKPMKLGNQEFWNNLEFQELWNSGEKSNRFDDEL